MNKPTRGVHAELAKLKPFEVVTKELVDRTYVVYARGAQQARERFAEGAFVRLTEDGTSAAKIVSIKEVVD